jgi:uncharacterized protein YrrD
MLRRAHSLIGTDIHALDGEMGHIDDFYFDDLTWTVRYMIVSTGSWFSEKHVLLSPTSIRDVVWEERAVYVDLSKEQIKESPDLELRKPVTREQELELVRHFRWPSYWLDTRASSVNSPANMGVATGVSALGVNAMGVYPAETSSPALPEHIVNDISSTGVSDTERLHDDIANSEEANVEAELQRAAQAQGLHHYLRGVKEVTGYHIAANDGEIGHVDDFFIDEEGWQIHYFLVDTGNWLPGRKVLIATKWITYINWEDAQVGVNATREQVKSSPEYDPRATLDRGYEGRLHTHYGLPPYWI